MAARASLLVHGLRAEGSEDTAEGDEADPEDRLWHRISETLLSRWPKPTPSPGTACAEKGLGIFGAPYYFYVMRAHRAFGYVVFLFEEVQTNASMPSCAKGATPFDTGGLWIGAIHPIKDKREKRDLFASEEVALERWQSTFFDYINNNYLDAQDYVHGKPPADGILRITRQSPRNDARAWTWEVRYPNSLASTWLRLDRAYMHRDDHTDYVDWLPRSDYEDHEIGELANVVEAKVKVYEDDSMAFGKAEAALVELI